MYDGRVVSREKRSREGECIAESGARGVALVAWGVGACGGVRGVDTIGRACWCVSAAMISLLVNATVGRESRGAAVHPIGGDRPTMWFLESLAPRPESPDAPGSPLNVS